MLCTGNEHTNPYKSTHKSNAYIFQKLSCKGVMNIMKNPIRYKIKDTLSFETKYLQERFL